MRAPRVTRVATFAVLGAVAAAVWVSAPYARGLSFVIRAADMQGALRRAADLDTVPIRTRDITVPSAASHVRARLYEPEGGFSRTALLVSGLHAAGIDEPRLVGLAQDLSASGLAVVTPDFPELPAFDITPAITDSIERAAAWLAANPEFAPDGRVGMMGISFSGGLSAVAAGRPSLAGRVAYVFSFGGHSELRRVLEYLCTGRVAGVVRPPHDYGLAVILFDMADHVVPGNQVEPLRAAVRRFLYASHLDRVDKPAAVREFATLRTLAATLPEPSRTLLTYVNDRDVAKLGPHLLPHVHQYDELSGLSPAKSPRPAAPVFLLHGVDDNVIPPEESTALGQYLAGHTETHVLLSGLISHAEADRPASLGDILELAGFWGDLLAR
jgi:dienelactone hydrolase